MMRYLSLWRKKVSYQSLLWLDSEAVPGVRFGIRKISLRQRIELSSRVRELTLRNEFLKAGEPADQLEAAIADRLVEKLYIEWAVTGIEGLRIDGATASVTMLIDSGPEALTTEMANAIRAQLELSEPERKN